MNLLEGIRGSTWPIIITSVRLDDVEVSEEILAECVITGRAGGVATTSYEADPEAGVRLRVLVSAEASALAVDTRTPYLSQINIEFPNGEVLAHQFRFRVNPSAD